MAKKKELKAKVAELETELMQIRRDMRCLIMEPNSTNATLVKAIYKQGYRLDNALWAGDCRDISIEASRGLRCIGIL